MSLQPTRYLGLAFGRGPVRVAMLMYGTEDIRHYHGNDLPFLCQFP